MESSQQHHETAPFFVGRDAEIGQLLSLAHEAFAGHANMVFLSGEAGSGKTSLVHEFFRRLRAEQDGVVIASGLCTLRSASYLPFQGILESLLSSRETRRLTSQQLRHVAEVVIDTIWKVGPDLIGVFGVPIKTLQTIIEHLGLRGKRSASDLAIPRDLDQTKIFGWYAKVMKDIAAHFPLVLFLDDLHWADDSSLNLLLHLGRELEHDPLLLLGTYRPHDTDPNALLLKVKHTLGRYGAREISLDRSDNKPEEAATILAFVHTYLVQKYGTHFSDRFERALADRTEGNALFLTELLNNMEDNGSLVHESSGWTLRSTIRQRDDLPDKIENVLAERIARLEQHLREILEFASVEGDEFTVQVLAAIRQEDEWRLLDALTDQLMAIHRLIREEGEKSLPNGEVLDEFSFRHNLIREYVYDRFPQAKKRRVHARIGERLEQLYHDTREAIAPALARHFFYAHRVDKAVQYCLIAAQDANRRVGASEALRFSEMGLEALEHRAPDQQDAQQKMLLLIEAARAEEMGGDQQEDRDHLAAGIALLEEHLEVLPGLPAAIQAACYGQLGRLYRLQGGAGYTKAAAYLEQSLRLYDDMRETRMMAEVLYFLGILYRWIPSPTPAERSPVHRAMQALTKSLTLAKELGETNLQALALSQLAWRYAKDNDFSAAEQSALQAP